SAGARVLARWWVRRTRRAASGRAAARGDEHDGGGQGRRCPELPCNHARTPAGGVSTSIGYRVHIVHVANGCVKPSMASPSLRRASTEGQRSAWIGVGGR